MQTSNRTTVSRHSSIEERQAALYQIYNQVLERQPYAYERRLIADAEQAFLHDKIGVKRFLKILGHSELYLNEFYYGSSNLKFLELCFKHFMGRAPNNHAELRHYCDILMRSGVQALITALIDSEEYRKHFGCFTVPHPYSQPLYESPKAYWESHILNHELHGRRGCSLPTLLWHELDLECNAGQCDSQPPHPLTFPASIDTDQVELLQMLRRIRPDDLEEIAAALPERQRHTLNRVLMKLQ